MDAETGNCYFLVWNREGLEYIENLTELAHDDLLRRLQLSGDQVDKFRSRVDAMFFHWTLRARANPQRCYETYAIQVEDGIGREDLEALYEQSPQAFVDLVRSRGHCIYDGRQSTAAVIN